MVRAHSLLYAIYICLIVSIICGALLYFANLYGQLNVHYNLQEELYLHNQSLVNYALGTNFSEEEILPAENSGIEGSFQPKQYGLLSLVLAKSYVRNDTVSSAHFIGHFAQDKTAIHLANFTRPLAYSGKVTIVGNVNLPSSFIETAHINNEHNQLQLQGQKKISAMSLPTLSSDLTSKINGLRTVSVSLTDLEKAQDSMYYNSFFNDTKEIQLNSVVSNMVFKGNFVLRSKDSLRIKKNAVLEDVILLAPKITFEEGFSGTVQAFATQGIDLEEKTTLKYPSAVCVLTTKGSTGKIRIKKGCKIVGAVVLSGNALEDIGSNTISIEEPGQLTGDIYCSGSLCLKSTVFGSVYTNRFHHQTASAMYENLVANLRIDVTKRPAYFIGFPLFETKNQRYGILKKVL